MTEKSRRREHVLRTGWHKTVRILCRKCGNRFLSLEIKERVSCPECEAEIDYEIGPDESLEDLLETADLKQKIEGEEEVEKMDALLSLAVTGGDFEWI